MQQPTKAAATYAPSEKETLSRWRRFLRFRNLNVVFLLITLVVAVAVFSTTSPYFFQARNGFNIGRAVSVIGIAGAFATILLISGGIDLSIGVVMNGAGVVAALILAELKLPLPFALAGGMIVGIIVGLVNGLFVAKVGINPLITTIGMTFIVRGLTYILSGAKAGVIRDTGMLFLGQGNVRVGTLRVPFALILMLSCFLLVYLVLNFTQFGKYVYAIGGNAVASRRAGIKVQRLQIYTYILSGASAAFAGLVLAGLTGAGVPYAAGSELSVISGVILGGTSLSGGVGTAQGTLLGVLLVGVLKNGMTLLNIHAHYQMVVEGVVLLIAVALDRIKHMA